MRPQIRSACLGGTFLLNEHGVVSNTTMPEGQHLNNAGYEIIGPELKNIIDEFWS